MHPLRRSRRAVWAALLLAAALREGAAAPSLPTRNTVEIVPVDAGPFTTLLNGHWQFRFEPTPASPWDGSFFRPDFDDRSWAPIRVPGHWELQGFAAPRYKRNLPGTGYYRRRFRLPAGWENRRTYLTFEGVLFGFDAWVNGVRIGGWASGYNRSTFDITDAVRAEGENVLAVRVQRQPPGYEFDENDDWALSGIYRDVVLFSAPPTHFAAYTIRPRLQPDGAARVAVSVRVAVPAAAAGSRLLVRGRLQPVDGGEASEFRVPLDAAPVAGARSAVTTVVLPRPNLWTAETPSLYTLALALDQDGTEVQRVEPRVGLREVTIQDGVLLLNGVPVKLRGIDRHELDPVVGRAQTEAMMRRDLALIQAANINFIRTSHYPPQARFLELCDELGLYVMCEVPFGYGEEHLTDPAYDELLLERASATVARDQNRPCVLVWSVGNENPVTPSTLATARLVKAADPTRPVCFPQTPTVFEETRSTLPPEIDVFAPHYPTNAALERIAQTVDRPVIVTEFAHALGLAFDRVEDQWETMYRHPRLAGGAVWHWMDQGLLRTSAAPVDGSQPTPYAWVDARHYYDTSRTEGADGLVYADRTPQIDYWQLRKVYAPIRVREVKGPAGRIDLEVENRFDFRSLAGFTLAWTLTRNGHEMARGAASLSAAAHRRETVSLEGPASAGAAADVTTLDLRFLDERRTSRYERSFRRGGDAESLRAALLQSLPPGAMRVEEAPEEVRVVHDRFRLRVNRRTARISVEDAGGTPLITELAPHVARKFTLADEVHAPKLNVWRGGPWLVDGTPEIMARVTDRGAEIVVRARYLWTHEAGRAMAGEIRLDVAGSGAIDVTYRFTPRGPAGALLEAGLTLVAPSSATQFRWIGDGPFAGYPGKNALNEFGRFHLDRGDLRFQGNRRQVDIAMLTDAQGRGLALAGSGMDIAVENGPGETRLSHNAVVSGRGNKIGPPETLAMAPADEPVAGRLTLVPLSGAAWPERLTAWFGDARDVVPAEHPFYHSYDQ